MKKYEKIVSQMIKDFAEKGLLQCGKSHERKIMDYLNYMGVVVVRSNEQNNPAFTVDDEMKDKIASIVSKQWDLYKETKVGSDLVNFYENKKMFDLVIENPKELDIFLPNVTSKKMIDELLIAFIKSGSLESVKKLIENPQKPKIKVDVNTCILAVINNQSEILEYLFSKDKYQVKNEQSYMGIYARKSIEYNSHDVFSYIIEKGLDIEGASLLGHAVFYQYKDYAYKLIDLGAKLQGFDSRVDKVFLEEITSYYNKKLLNDNLECDLKDKPKKKSAKI